MESNRKKNREIICGAAGLIAAAVFFVGCLKIPAISDKISSLGNINIVVYGMTLILFCLVFIVGLCIAGRKKTAENPCWNQEE